MNKLRTQCCIAGGGPAGLMLGYLLARAGVDVIVLEKHGSFLDDFRGNTIHPSTMHTMHELGILDEFIKIPHYEISKLEGVYNGTRITLSDYTHLPVARPVFGYMPQHLFLGFIAGNAQRYPGFHLHMNAEATGLRYNNGEVCGITVTTADGPAEIDATIVVAADGRNSRLRSRSGLKAVTREMFIDVLWFKMSKQPGDSSQAWYHRNGRTIPTIDMGGYWQCGCIIRKDTLDHVKSKGLAAFKQEVADTVPFLANRTHEITSWDDVKMLKVEMNCLHKWYIPGLLCIGDAAHAMSPVGGVGINFAIQDAITAANALYAPLLKGGKITARVLAGIQRKRLWRTRAIQRIQSSVQQGLIAETQDIPPFFRAMQRFPILRRIPARVLGIGFTLVHVKTPDVLEERYTSPLNFLSSDCR